MQSEISQERKFVPRLSRAAEEVNTLNRILEVNKMSQRIATEVVEEAKKLDAPLRGTLDELIPRYPLPAYGLSAESFRVYLNDWFLLEFDEIQVFKMRNAVRSALKEHSQMKSNGDIQLSSLNKEDMERAEVELENPNKVFSLFEITQVSLLVKNCLKDFSEENNNHTLDMYLSVSSAPRLDALERPEILAMKMIIESRWSPLEMTDAELYEADRVFFLFDDDGSGELSKTEFEVLFNCLAVNEFGKGQLLSAGSIFALTQREDENIQDDFAPLSRLAFHRVWKAMRSDPKLFELSEPVIEYVVNRENNTMLNSWNLLVEVVSFYFIMLRICFRGTKEWFYSKEKSFYSSFWLLLLWVVCAVTYVGPIWSIVYYENQMGKITYSRVEAYFPIVYWLMLSFYATESLNDQNTSGVKASEFEARLLRAKLMKQCKAVVRQITGGNRRRVGCLIVAEGLKSYSSGTTLPDPLEPISSKHFSIRDATSDMKMNLFVSIFTFTFPWIIAFVPMITRQSGISSGTEALVFVLNLAFGLCFYFVIIKDVLDLRAVKRSLKRLLILVDPSIASSYFDVVMPLDTPENVIAFGHLRSFLVYSQKSTLRNCKKLLIALFTAFLVALGSGGYVAIVEKETLSSSDAGHMLVLVAIIVILLALTIILVITLMLNEILYEQSARLKRILHQYNENQIASHDWTNVFYEFGGLNAAKERTALYIRESILSLLATMECDPLYVSFFGFPINTKMITFLVGAVAVLIYFIFTRS